MASIISGQIGPSIASDGVQSMPMRQGKTGEQIVTELHGRFYEQTYRAALFSNGMTLTALTANTISLGAAATPILGIYNPGTSSVNAIVAQAALRCVINTVTTPVGAGAFVWASSVGNNAVSTGTAGFNRKTLASSGAQAKGMAFVAMTGLTNNVVIFEGADFSSPSGLTYGTIAVTATETDFGGVQNFDGSLIVPPGGMLALLNTVSTTTMSVTGRILWEEVPV